MLRKEAVECFDQIVRSNSAACAAKAAFDREASFIEDLGFDSLASIKLISDIEEKFDIEFDINELVYDVIGCYGTLLDNVMSKIEKKGDINE